MVDRKTTAQARKRMNKVFLEDFWDCSVCTLRNSPENFKCSACDVRKGTSTRKPRLSQQIVDQQEATRLVTISQLPPTTSASPTAVPGSKRAREDSHESHEDLKISQSQKHGRMKKGRCHIQGIDRNSANDYNITVNNRTVVFTEFQPKVVNSA